MFSAFVASVMAGVVANMISYYLCKWLDGKRNGN
jgi:membrane protein DedA with SNARE-associated domain